VCARGDAVLAVPDDPSGARFAALFDGSRVSVERAGDFTTRAWVKLCVNVAGAVTALTGRPLGVIRRPDVAEFARALVRETMIVAQAEGAHLTDDLADAVVDDLQRGNPEATPSILQDLRAGRPLEWDARNGAVVRAGARHGVPTPLNAAVCALLAAISDSSRG
jgi:2-dehydropantoate 2-reductase